jgi:alginate biosynthesis protein Alg44
MAIQSIATAKIQHESEKQRHHVRVEIPAIAVIDHTKYTTGDISAGGFSVKAGQDVFEKGEQDVKVYFPFNNFAFHLKLQARPVYFNPHSGRVGYIFPEIDPRQLSLLHLVIKSTLSGELTSDGQVMEALKQRNAPKPANYPHSRWSRIIPMGIISLAGLAGLVLLGSSIYENTSIVKSYTAVIEADTYAVRATESGVFSSLLANGAHKVVKGQEIAVLKQPGTIASEPSGAQATQAPPQAAGTIIKSPCDCYVFKTFAKEGEFRTTGEELFELLPLQPNAWVTASIRPDQTHRLKLQDDAYVQLMGENKFIDGHVSAFLPPNFENGTSQVRVKTSEPLPPEAVGQPAYVEFVIF